MPGKTTSPEIRKLIISNHLENLSSRAISNKLNCPQKTVSRIIKLYKDSGKTEVKSRSGRPRKTDTRIDRLICRKSKNNRFLTANDIQASLSNVNISTSTIRRRLCENNLFGRIAKKKPLISERNRRIRLAWAKEKVNWSTAQWKLVLFTDESKIVRFSRAGRVFVRRSFAEKYKIICTRPTVQGGGDSLMVWGCMTADGPGPLHRLEGRVTAQTYCDLLRDVVDPYMDENMPIRSVYQHDNAPIHTARIVGAVTAELGMNVMKWPPQSPDLNPIENAWKILKTRVAKEKNLDKEHFWPAVQKHWKQITHMECTNLVSSMTRRCREVIQNKGYTTHY